MELQLWENFLHQTTLKPSENLPTQLLSDKQFYEALQKLRRDTKKENLFEFISKLHKKI